MAAYGKKDAGEKLMRDLKGLGRELKEGHIKNVYLFYGDETYLLRQWVENIKKALALHEGDMNYSHFEGEAVDERSLMDLADTMPFFSDHRLIVVEDSGFFSSSHPELAEYIETMPDSCCMVFAEKKADSRQKMYKAVVKRGEALEMSLPPKPYLMSWLEAILAAENRKADRAVLSYFLDAVPQDMYSMRNEIDKLIDYTGDSGKISREDIEKVCSTNVENRIFDMIDAIARKDEASAMDMYNDLLVLREAPLRILYNLNSQFSRLYQIKDLVEMGYSRTRVSEKTGIRDFIVRKSLPLCDSFELSSLRQSIEEGTELEEAVKTGNMDPGIAVESMIVRYSRI